MNRHPEVLQSMIYRVIRIRFAVLRTHLEFQVVVLDQALQVLVAGDLGDCLEGDAAAPHVHNGTRPGGWGAGQVKFYKFSILPPTLADGLCTYWGRPSG